MHILRERKAALSRLEQQINRGLLLEGTPDWEKAISRARFSSEKHAETTGARTLDILHVAFALELRFEIYLTTDKLQAEVAKAEHLNAVFPVG
ncbi:MAG: hypothetical protein JWM16_4290 [Verrucomicrobiales bacterium]|nr:hypothetical protein [Verrucomicrobiales bacterium]